MAASTQPTTVSAMVMLTGSICAAVESVVEGRKLVCWWLLSGGSDVVMISRRGTRGCYTGKIRQQARTTTYMDMRLALCPFSVVSENVLDIIMRGSLAAP